ncbi:MAG: ABC transporter substrate-binding protein, partial [Bacteroidales bacterium]|nr:ABC transporter substrate-binding protein [Bacteroidales bacterium]
KSAALNGDGEGSSSVNGGTSSKAKKSVEQTDFEKRAAEKKAARNAEREKRKGRKNRQTPTTPEDYVVEEPEPEVVVTPDSTAVADSMALAEELAKSKKKRPDFLKKDDICATLLLPFNAGSGAGNDLSMDFYSGALLAAKHLSEDYGISLYINVFDCYGDALPEEKDLSYSEIVVGMLSKNGFSELMEYAPKNCRVVSPLDMNTLPLTESHPNFYQCSNSTTAQYDDIAQWLADDMSEEDRILIIHEKSLAGTDQAEEVGAALDRGGLSWTTFSYSILDGRDINASLAKQMVEEGVNRVIIATSNEAFANDAIRNLNVLIHSDFNIVLYGGSKIRGFDNIPVENLHNVNFHSSQSFHIDYDDPRVQKFLMEYRALFNTEPSQTAFQGYDVMCYFAMMNRRVRTGRFVERSEEMSMLMSDFEFERCGEYGGFVRTGVRRTVYEPDYSITYLK